MNKDCKKYHKIVTISKAENQKTKEYYENNKARLQEQARNKYRKLSNKEKDTKTKRI